MRKKKVMNEKKDNEFRVEGAKAISEMLKVNTTLTILNMRSEYNQ